MPPICITMGDAAGVGPEIIAKAFAQDSLLATSCFVAGDIQAMRRATAIVAGSDLSLPVFALDAPSDSRDVPAGALPVLQIGQPMQLPAFGQVNALAGAFAAHCVEWAATAALNGEVGALVTAPLNKEALGLADSPYRHFPGHTELLQALAARYQGCSPKDLPVRMMLANEEIRVVLVSTHMSLREAIEAVTFEQVLRTISITHTSLLGMLGRVPRVAVAGLNPHAGEGGRFGREELDIIQPAVNAARGLGMDANGPFPPDTVFMAARCSDGKESMYDAVVAMYHDQGLIPVKYLGVERGVNVTLGLPIVRTSPDHGTAFDIAGTGKANAESLRGAIREAQKMLTS